DCTAAIQASPWCRWRYYRLAQVYCMRAESRPPGPEGEAARNSDITLAIQELERGFEKGLGQCVLLKDYPEMKVLRDDPRFQKLVAQPQGR
ncbi:MAG: hypothetical protein ABSE73_31760, partial [Planctomycetota bacterium]